MIFTFVEALIVFTALIFLFVLGLLSKLSIVGLSFDENSSFWTLLNSCILFLFVLFLGISVFSILTGQRFSLWLYLYLLLIAGAVCLMAMPKLHQRRALTICMISLPVIVIAVSLSISGPLPITQDEGRFTGYAFRIIEDGNWVSFRYPENVHYQFFPVISSIKAIVSMVTGLDLLNAVHPLLVLSLTLLASLSVFMLAKSSINKEKQYLSLAALAPILFILTPPLSTLAFIPQILSAVLCLISLSIVIKALYAGSFTRANLLVVIIISVIGIIIHSTYSLLFLPSVGILLFISKKRHSFHFPKPLSSTFKIVTLITLVYWTFTLILDQMVTIGRTLQDGFIEFITGSVVPFESGRPMWYAQVTPETALSWALLPAFAGAFILFESVRARKIGFASIKKYEVFIGIIALIFLALGLISRSMPQSFHRYLYPAYFLLIIPSIFVIKGAVHKRKLFGLLMVALIISVTSFYALQDPAISPDIQKSTLVADKRSWTVAETLASYASVSTSYFVDPRVIIGFETFMISSSPNTYLSENNNQTSVLLVLSLDDLGIQWADYRLGKELNMDYQLINVEHQQYSMVYSDGTYSAFYINTP